MRCFNICIIYTWKQNKNCSDIAADNGYSTPADTYLHIYLVIGVIGTHGNTTSSTKKLLQVICSSRDSFDSKLSRCVYDYWMTMISFTLHKTVASQIIVQSARTNGRHYSGPYAVSSFPDSTDIHFDMNG